MVFNSKIDLKNVVKSYSIIHHQNSEVIESKKNIWVVRFKKYDNGWMWRLRTCCCKKHGKFEITQCNGPHSCVYARMSQDHNQLDSNFIATEVSSIVKKNPSVNVRPLQDIVLKKYGYFVSYWKVWDGRRKAVARIFGDWIESYNLLPSWMNILEMTNPGTVVNWRLHEVEGDDRIFMFNSVFWSLDLLLRASSIVDLFFKLMEHIYMEIRREVADS